MTSRRPKTDYLTRAEVETMIAAAVAAERDRSEKAMAAVLFAIGETARSLEATSKYLVDFAATLDNHWSLLAPIAKAFAAARAAENPPVGTVPN